MEMLNKMAGFTEAVKQPLFQGWLQQLYNPWTSDCNYNKVNATFSSCTTTVHPMFKTLILSLSLRINFKYILLLSFKFEFKIAGSQ